MTSSVLYSIIIPIDLARRPFDILKKLNEILKHLDDSTELIIGHNNRLKTIDRFLLNLVSRKKNIKIISSNFFNGLSNNSLLRNKAVQACSNEIIFLMDVDIWFDKELFSRCAKIVEMGEKPFVMLPCIYLTKKGSRKIKHYGRDKMFKHFISFRRDLFQHIASPSSFMVLKKSDYFTVGGFDETFEGHGYEDFDFMIRLSLHYGLIDRSDELLIDKPYRSPILSEGFRKHLGQISLPYFFEKMVAFHLYHKKDKQEKYYEKRKDNAKYFMKKISNLLNEKKSSEPQKLKLFDFYKKLCEQYAVSKDTYGVLLDCRTGHIDRVDTFKRKIKYTLKGY